MRKLEHFGGKNTMIVIVTDNIAYCTSNVVSHNCVSMCTKKDYRLHCHLIGAHSIHKHLILCLHLAQILAPRSLSKILHHWPDILLDTRIHVPIIFLVNVSWWGKVVSLFPSAVPLPIHTDVWPMWEVVTRDLRKRGSSTRTGGRPFLIMSSLQHSTNLAWVGVLISITLCNEIQRSVCTTSTETELSLRFAEDPLLEVTCFCHSTCMRGFLTALPRNVFYEDHAMLVVILCTVRQSFPLPVSFPMLGSIWHSTLNISYRYLLPQ
jgi:hypothetical protein